jgi:hypothetical protein
VVAFALPDRSYLNEDRWSLGVANPYITRCFAHQYRSILTEVGWIWKRERDHAP